VVFDDQPPEAAIVLADGAAATNNLTVQYSIDSADPGIGVTDMRLAADAGPWGDWGPVASTGTWTFAGQDGSRALRVQVRDAAGNLSTSGTDTVVVDRTAPVPRAPSAAFVAGSTLTNGRLPVRINYATSDTGSGVASYALQRRVGAASYQSVTLSPGATSIVSTLGSSGTTYRFRARARDRAGNISVWSERTLTLRRYEDSSSALAYGGRWDRRVTTSASGGTTRTTSTLGRTVALTFRGRAVAIVTPTGVGRGRLAVYLDGKRVGTIDQYARASAARRVIHVAAATPGLHTLRLKVIERSPSSSGRRVDIDAFVVMP
jgi:hypothetical protein